MEVKLNKEYKVSNTNVINLPIDYMQLNECEFNDGLIATKEEIIDIPVGKYLMDTDILEKIKSTESNTVVINSSVGQGKSTLAIEIAKRYYKKKVANRYKYTVIFAVPYKSLIKQYKDKLIEEVNKGERYGKILTSIPDYNNLTWKKNDNPENGIPIQSIR